MSFNTNMENPGYNHTINNESIQKPDTIVHLGITHHRNYRKTTSTQIQENMEKSMCTLYSLLGAVSRESNCFQASGRSKIFVIHT